MQSIKTTKAQSAKGSFSNLAGALKLKLKKNVNITPENAVRLARKIKILDLKKKYKKRFNTN